jgi:hypothetical protein
MGTEEKCLALETAEKKLKQVLARFNGVRQGPDEHWSSQ